MQNPRSPYQISQATEPVLDMPTQNQQELYKQDEMGQKAPPTLTYPLETLNEFVGNILVCLTQIRGQLNIAKNMPVADQKAIAQITKKIDQINMIAITIPEILDGIKL